MRSVIPPGRLPSLLLGVLVFGLAGTLLELVLIEHYEDTWQLAPIGLIGLSLVVALWHAVRPHGISATILSVLMVAVLLVGVLGVQFHFNGAAEFQREIDPSQGGWTLFVKVLRAKAPPVLAPGLMTQLGLLGLVYVYAQRVNRMLSERSDK